MTASEKPASPPTQPVARTTFPPAIICQLMRPEQERTTARELERHEAACLFLDIAGDTPEHIVMNTNPNRLEKYLTVHRPLTLADMRLHLTGTKTFGATLQHIDGTTRALCFDEDDPAWQRLQDAATLLVAAGYKPLLEPSPAGRGGHLWIIFSDRVNAAAAYTQVYNHAPTLRDIAEYWPGRGNQKVRLPAGRYVTPTFAAWTTLYDADRREVSKSRSNFFLTHLTPAELIPAQAPAVKQEPLEAPKPERNGKQHQRRPAITAPDERHRRKYGKHDMWVAFSEQYLIDRFNSEHSIDDLAALDRNGMINASQIGRAERTASVRVTPDGQRFTDFGAGARRPDGTQDGGDPFEFYIRREGRAKAEVLRELGRELNRAASSELLRAARNGEVPPAWVMEIMTERGRVIYNENATRNGHPTLEALAGFSTQEQTEGQEQQREMETSEKTHKDRKTTVSETAGKGVWQSQAERFARNDRGLLIYCSQCEQRATWYGKGATPYCNTHWHEQKRDAYPGNPPA